jgi:ribose transport system ATP-binding protein
MRLLPELSIAENIFVGRMPMKGWRIDRDAMNTIASLQLRRLGLEIAPTEPVRNLPIAAQQQVEIVKALVRNARLLILDEPTAALGAAETDRLFEQIERLKRDGVAFLSISHRLDEIARVADRVVVLRDGRQVAAHDTAQLPVERLIQDMVGRSVDRIFPAMPAPASDQAVLVVQGLTAANGAFADVSFTVRPGEVFGIAGIVGAGRTELVRAIAGADPIRCGTIEIAGKRVVLSQPHDAIAHDIVMVPEDRKREGVILDHTIADNLSYANFDRIARRGWFSHASAALYATESIERLAVKGRADQAAGSLSGGNQQKIVIAKWIGRSPRIMIMDEPTRGIDVGARAAIYDLIGMLVGQGVAVIVVSSDLDEVLGLSHRVMVLSRGRSRGILDRREATGTRVMELATT